MLDLVHAPLARWASLRGEAIALDDGETTLTFAQLHDAVQAAAQALTTAQAPATVFVSDRVSTVHRVVEFLGIVASGRCAAVGDPDWTDAVREAMREAVQATLATQVKGLPPPGPTTPFYIGFTSGSTGIPKGFRRHHRSWTESFRVCLQTFGPDAASTVMAPGRFSHSLFLFGMLHGLWSGAGVVIQERFSAARTLDTLRQGRTPCLVAVPSQLVMMLALAARRVMTPIAHVKLILISGARWMRDRTPELKALFPAARVVEFYGASETSFIAWKEADASAHPHAVGQPFANVEIDIRERQTPGGAGLIFVRSPMLFMDYVGRHEDATAAVRDGEWLSVRDMGYVNEQGELCLIGRQNRMIVTQGKNLFPEELEAVLLACPFIASASVQGVPDPVRGQQVVAVVQIKAQALAAGLTASQLAAWCRERLEAYKVPRRFFRCEDWPLTPGGKTDHPALALSLSRNTGGHHRHGEDGACLHPLP